MKRLTSLDGMRWTNPNGVDLSKPYIYLITIESPHKTYRYVGKGSSSSRMDAYRRNVSRILEGKTKRPAVKRDGQAQSDGNLRYRYVHLALAVAARSGWRVTHIPLENCDKADHNKIESLRRREHACDLNEGPSWPIEEFEHLASTMQ